MARPEPIPAYEDNYIWLLRDGPATLVVDPGDAAPVIARLGDVAPTAITRLKVWAANLEQEGIVLVPASAVATAPAS